MPRKFRPAQQRLFYHPTTNRPKNCVRRKVVISLREMNPAPSNEPLTHLTEPNRPATPTISLSNGHLTRRSISLETPPSAHEKSPIDLGLSLKHNLLVEDTGLEPVTFRLPA